MSVESKKISEQINNPKLDIVETLRNIANGLENGELDNVSINKHSNGSMEIITNKNNERTIINEQKLPGYDKSSVEIIKNQKPKDRRKTVCQLKREGLTQTEIAKKTNVSRKTISNDIKYLKDNKECQ